MELDRRPGRVQRGLPRWVDAAVAGLGLLVTSPLLAVLAAAVRLSSPGPALFRQERVGLGGRPFTMFKLRTMRLHRQGPQVTMSGDERVTKVGRLLRKSKLDELPELWNVLAGDMALVGPRPEVPRYVDLDSPLWQWVLEARPGLSDPVTLGLRNEEALLADVGPGTEHWYRTVLVPFKLLGYVDYQGRRSWRTDLGVLLRTGWGILRPDTAPAPSPADITSALTGRLAGTFRHLSPDEVVELLTLGGLEAERNGSSDPAETVPPNLS